jgi:hypothetical protein
MIRNIVRYVKVSLCLYFFLIIHPTTVFAAVNCDSPRDDYIYDASGYMFFGRMRICDDELLDLTTGQYAPARGQRLFYVSARGINRSFGTWVRAVPNRSYNLHVAIPGLFDGAVVRWAREPTVAWQNEPFLFPFVPTQILSISGDPSDPLYGYTRLEPLPGFSSAMAPLTRESVIIAIHGYSFARTDALQAFMSTLLYDSSYVEVLYVESRRSTVIKRAFLPVIPRNQAASSWVALTRQHPIFERRNSNSVEGWVALGAALAAITAFQNSSIGRSYERARQECLAQNTLIPMC